MKTRITEMMGIQYPIFLSGMSWISVPELVAAVSNAGGLGILATGPLEQEQTRAAIRKIRTLTDKPFGANASLLFPGAKESAKVLLEEQVPVINFALGKGDWIVEAAHKYGGKVVATVVSPGTPSAPRNTGATRSSPRATRPLPTASSSPPSAWSRALWTPWTSLSSPPAASRTAGAWPRPWRWAPREWPWAPGS